MNKDETKRYQNGVECAKAVLEYVKVTLPMYDLELTFENLQMVLSDAIVKNCLDNKVMPGREFAAMSISAGVLAPLIKAYYESEEDKSE